MTWVDAETSDEAGTLTDTMSGEFVVGATDGPLAGLTAFAKDMYDIAGTRTGGGNPTWLAEQALATGHASVIETIVAAGATITGKAICDEFFYSIMGINAH